MTFGFGMGFPRAAAAAGGPSLNLQFAGSTALDPLITFTRASTGTYYDSSGVLRVSPLNLLPYSEQFDNAAWVKSNATVSSNVMTAPDGTLTGDALIEDTTTSVHSVAEVASLVATTTYALSVFAKASTRTLVRVAGRIFSSWSSFPDATFDLVSGTVTSVSGAGTPKITNVGNGWFRCVVFGTASATNAGMSINLVLTGTNSTYTGDGTSGLYIWGAQLETGSTATTYIPTTGAVNSAPRFDYNPTTRASLGLLIEEQRTNLLTYSEQFDNAAWTKTAVTINANSVVSPDGTVNADGVFETAVVSEHNVFQGSIATTLSQAYAFTVYLKAAGRTKAILRNNINNGSNVNVGFDLQAGTVTFTPTDYTASITPVGNDWFRCGFVTTVATAGTRYAAVALTDTDPTNNSGASYLGDVTKGMVVWGAQLEAGAFATSYIPTTTAAATRAADNASITTLTPWYNSTTGTLAVNGSGVSDGNARYAVSFNDATLTEFFGIRTLNNISSAGIDGAVNQWGLSKAYTSNATFKSALALAVNDIAFTADGAAPATDAAATLPTVNQMQIGTGPGLPIWNGTISSIAFYPRRLSDAELQSITA